MSAYVCSAYCLYRSTSSPGETTTKFAGSESIVSVSSSVLTYCAATLKNAGPPPS
ncbi:hypothetical protein [Cohnella rhizosphaerae]|uniref:Uncharacterized protein n=1 Tax=Cohnella rhizosphaerae TaxID=1457232 RepID=A0A9X4KUN5_9BACL|nr:hypothetical protein [Cohnella rhizosphaerae]MDG0809229.1 hypothetical protein [Cohnella rhizosphaerae]